MKTFKVNIHEKRFNSIRSQKLVEASCEGYAKSKVKDMISMREDIYVGDAEEMIVTDFSNLLK